MIAIKLTMRMTALKRILSSNNESGEDSDYEYNYNKKGKFEYGMGNRET